MPFIQTILHPTDYSEGSRRALEWAVRLAHEQGARLLILHVELSLEPEQISYGEATTEPQPEAFQRELQHRLEQVRPTDPSLQVEYLLVEGDPAREILRVARERACDLIVLATHGRSGLSRLLSGSVAEDVIRHASCPVVSVRVA
jgi:nucleotide-binding universal stress UspA family protein